MSWHPTEEELLRFRQGSSGSSEKVLRDHLAGCRSCRENLAEAAGFDEFIRQGLKREAAPEHLLERIQQGLDNQKIRPVGTSPWRRMALSSAAAALLAVLGLTSLWIWADSVRPEGLTGFSSQIAETQVLRGQLVCFGCARDGFDMEHQQHCQVNRDLHRTGLKTPDGNLWRFVEGEAIHPFLDDPLLRGRWLEVSAQPYPAIGYLQISAARQI